MLSENATYLPQGTQVTNHAMTRSMMQEDINNEVSRQLKSSTNKSNEISNRVKEDSRPNISVVQNISNSVTSPGELARQTKNSLRELALSF